MIKTMVRDKRRGWLSKMRWENFRVVKESLIEEQTRLLGDVANSPKSQSINSRRLYFFVSSKTLFPSYRKSLVWLLLPCDY